MSVTLLTNFIMNTNIDLRRIRLFYETNMALNFVEKGAHCTEQAPHLYTMLYLAYHDDASLFILTLIQERPALIVCKYPCIIHYMYFIVIHHYVINLKHKKYILI